MCASEIRGGTLLGSLLIIREPHYLRDYIPDHVCMQENMDMWRHAEAECLASRCKAIDGCCPGFHRKRTRLPTQGWLQQRSKRAKRPCSSSDHQLQGCESPQVAPASQKDQGGRSAQMRWAYPQPYAHAYNPPKCKNPKP